MGEVLGQTPEPAQTIIDAVPGYIPGVPVEQVSGDPAAVAAGIAEGAAVVGVTIEAPDPTVPRVEMGVGTTFANTHTVRLGGPEQPQGS